MSTLDAFLNAETKIEGEVYLRRLNSHIAIKAVTEDELDAIREQTTHYVGTGQNRKKVTNDEEFTGLLIAEACINKEFDDPRLHKKHGARDTADCARKALLPGELMKLQTEILKLSGFGDDEELLDEVKN